MLHLRPFQRSARVTGIPERVEALPTAWQPVEVTQATPNSPPGSPAGGVGTMFQRVPFHRSARNPPRSLGLEVPPTAMQDLADAQATLNRPLAPAPAWLGADWIAQLLPFQRSARVTGVLRLLIELPTAVQAEAEVHETAFRAVRWKANGGMRGLGSGWICHRVPSQRSASGAVSGGLVEYPPAAVHAEADVHDTAFRKLDCASDGLGEGTMRHAVPSHSSARIPASEPPTAVHPEAEVHDTAFKKLDCAPDGLGEGMMRHAVPSHCSARVPAFEPPTAVHAEAEVHDTLDSASPPAAGLGVG
jgi:hypothetical protein